MPRTSNGIDWQAGVLGNPSSTGTGAFAPACYIGLSADSTAPSSGDTSLPGEIVSGSLSRTIGTYAHTTGTNSYTLSALFTSDQTVTLNKIGIFNASSAGTLFLETLLSTPANLNTGDQIEITETVSL